MEMTEAEKDKVKEHLEDMVRGIVDKAIREENLEIVTSLEEPYVSYRKEQLDFVFDLFPDGISEDDKQELYMKLMYEILQTSLQELFKSLQGDLGSGLVGDLD